MRGLEPRTSFALVSLCYIILGARSCDRMFREFPNFLGRPRPPHQPAYDKFKMATKKSIWGVPVPKRVIMLCITRLIVPWCSWCLCLHRYLQQFPINYFQIKLVFTKEKHWVSTLNMTQCSQKYLRIMLQQFQLQSIAVNFDAVRDQKDKSFVRTLTIKRKNCITKYGRSPDHIRRSFGQSRAIFPRWRGLRDKPKEGQCAGLQL